MTEALLDGLKNPNLSPGERQVLYDAEVERHKMWLDQTFDVLGSEKEIRIFERLPTTGKLRERDIDMEVEMAKLIQTGNFSLNRRITLGVHAESGTIDDETLRQLLEEHVRFNRNISAIIGNSHLGVHPTLDYESFYSKKLEAERRAEMNSREAKKLEPVLEEAKNRGLRLFFEAAWREPIFVDEGWFPGELPKRFFVVEEGELKELTLPVEDMEKFLESLETLGEINAKIGGLEVFNKRGVANFARKLAGLQVDEAEEEKD